MIYFTANSENGVVEYINYKPFDKKWGLGKTKEELSKTGHLVEKLPTPEVKEGLTPVLKFNGEALEYEYVEEVIELSELDKLRNTVSQQEKAIAELTQLVSFSMMP